MNLWIYAIIHNLADASAADLRRRFEALDGIAGKIAAGLIAQLSVARDNPCGLP
jgi:hypothetical protein